MGVADDGDAVEIFVALIVVSSIGVDVTVVVVIGVTFDSVIYHSY